jgi:hypothetical protein
MKVETRRESEIFGTFSRLSALGGPAAQRSTFSGVS